MSSKSQLIFYDGFILGDKILVASEESKPSQNSKVTLIQDGIWSFATLPDKVISVAGLNTEKKGFFLGEGGHILGTGFGVRHLENLPFDDQLGSFLRIRNIDEKIYVCGMSGQVLNREKNKWRKIDRGIRGRLNLDFEDIAGNSEKDLYAVSTYGQLYHYDGRKWTQIKIKSERPLSGITRVSKKDFLICGDEGVLILGSGQQWKTLEVGKWKQTDFWAVEVFKKKIYVAHGGGLLRLERGQLKEVEIPFKKTQDFHRLHASQKFLYSFGTSRILKFDGKKWTEVKIKIGKTAS